MIRRTFWSIVTIMLACSAATAADVRRVVTALDASATAIQRKAAAEQAASVISTPIGRRRPCRGSAIFAALELLIGSPFRLAGGPHRHDDEPRFGGRIPNADLAVGWQGHAEICKHALGIDDRDPSLLFDVLEREVGQERALAAPGPTLDVEMLTAVGLGDADRDGCGSFAQAEDLTAGWLHPFLLVR